MALFFCPFAGRPARRRLVPAASNPGRSAPSSRGGSWPPWRSRAANAAPGLLRGLAPRFDARLRNPNDTQRYQSVPSVETQPLIFVQRSAILLQCDMRHLRVSLALLGRFLPRLGAVQSLEWPLFFAPAKASTPRGKSPLICRKLARDFPRIRRTSKQLNLVQLFRGKFALEPAAHGCEPASGFTSYSAAILHPPVQRGSSCTSMPVSREISHCSPLNEGDFSKVSSFI